jgi:integrase
MATLQERNGSYRVLFCFQGKQLSFTLGRVEQAEAEAKIGQVDLLLLRLSQRLAVIPPGMTIVDYLKFDGRPLPAEAPEIKATKLSTLTVKYLAANKASLERTTYDCTKTHFGHFEKVLGVGFTISSLALSNLQEYVNKRAKDPGKNGRTLSATTIQKEIHTLRAAWKWGAKNGLVAGPFPNDGLCYPRTTELPIFMTRQEIERHVAAGGLDDAEIADLWHSMYLTVPEVTQFLEYVKKNALQPFIYPTVCFVAHTGARRSEMLRARIADVDFTGKMITIHEKKRVKGRNTTRRVPLTPFLDRVLRDWLAIHPGGPFLFCQEELPRRGVTRHGKEGSGFQLNRGKAYDHFQRVLGKSKWKVVAGFHVLRHSFISACAVKGIDQRFIDEWVGHSTDQQRRRYRHLAPSSQQQALSLVFGKAVTPRAGSVQIQSG